MANGNDSKDMYSSRFAFLLILTFVVAILGIVSLWFLAGRPYDPFILSRADNVRAKSLADTARTRPLTDGEFTESLALMTSDESIAQLMILSVLDIESKRDPARRDKVIAALKDLPAKTDPKVRQAVAVSLKRISE